MRCGTIGSCLSATTSEIVKALLVTSLTHVSGTITSVQTFTFITATFLPALARVCHNCGKIFRSSFAGTHVPSIKSASLHRLYLAD